MSVRGGESEQESSQSTMSVEGSVREGNDLRDEEEMTVEHGGLESIKVAGDSECEEDVKVKREEDV